jgi:hypothetical protein
MKCRLVLFLAIVCYSSWGLAQTCPASITGTAHANSLLPEWTVKSKSETYQLGGIEIIGGPMNANENEFEMLLAPRNKNETNYWSMTVGENEAWMRCHYVGTSLTLAPRLKPDIVECFQQWRKARDPRGQLVSAMCVDERYIQIHGRKGVTLHDPKPKEIASDAPPR